MYCTCRREKKNIVMLFNWKIHTVMVPNFSLCIHVHTHALVGFCTIINQPHSNCNNLNLPWPELYTGSIVQSLACAIPLYFVCITDQKVRSLFVTSYERSNLGIDCVPEFVESSGTLRRIGSTSWYQWPEWRK